MKLPQPLNKVRAREEVAQYVSSPMFAKGLQTTAWKGARVYIVLSVRVCVCVFSFHLLGLACVFTCEEQRGVTEVESAVSRSAAH